MKKNFDQIKNNYAKASYKEVISDCNQLLDSEHAADVRWLKNRPLLSSAGFTNRRNVLFHKGAALAKSFDDKGVASLKEALADFSNYNRWKNLYQGDENSEVALCLAKALCSLGKYEEARELLRSEFVLVNGMLSDDPEVKVLEAFSLLGLGRYEEARNEVSTLLDEASEIQQKQIYLIQGLSYYELEEYSDAIRSFNRLLPEEARENVSAADTGLEVASRLMLRAFASMKPAVYGDFMSAGLVGYHKLNAHLALGEMEKVRSIFNELSGDKSDVRLGDGSLLAVELLLKEDEGNKGMIEAKAAKIGPQVWQQGMKGNKKEVKDEDKKEMFEL